jgi:hypothetical protein
MGNFKVLIANEDVLSILKQKKKIVGPGLYLDAESHTLKV